MLTCIERFGLGGKISNLGLAVWTSLLLGQYGKAKVCQTFEANTLLIIWLFALFLLARNQPVGITEEQCPRISQSECALYQLETQVV